VRLPKDGLFQEARVFLARGKRDGKITVSIKKIAQRKSQRKLSASPHDRALDTLVLVEGSTEEGVATGRGKVGATDPVMQLLNEAKERAGITLTPEQRTAIVKILRELVERDVRSIRELLRSIQGGMKK
jgi:hypothetical protein